jgi:penicillin-binding protein 1B
MTHAQQGLERLRTSFRRHPRRWAVAGAALLIVLTGSILMIRLAATVEALRSRRATGPSWSFPSRLYTAGLPLVPTRPLPIEYLQRELSLRGYRRVPSPPRDPGSWAMGNRGVEIVLRGFRDAPDPEGRGGPEHVRLEIAAGSLQNVERLGGVSGAPPPDLHHPPRLEPVLFATLMDDHRVRRTWVPLARIPKVVRDAVVASEDRRFYHHHGLDLRSNFRALMVNLRAGGVREGGSTITQQLARGLFLGSQRTWDRKLREMVLAVELEWLLSKDQILEMYLNLVYWGRSDEGGVAGIGEAARFYFDRPVDGLRLPEAALLAGLIPAPNPNSPFRDPRAALIRRNKVLGDMVEAGFLNAATAVRARRQPLGVRRGPPPPEYFPSYSGYVRDWMGQSNLRLPTGALEHWGLAIFTTLDPVWQIDAERALRAGIEAQERWSGRAGPPLEGAFVALDPGSGCVRALVGGRHPTPGDFNRAFQAHRQPGSAIKPLVYAIALERVRGITPATTLSDQRRVFDTAEGVWSPKNDENEYHPSVTIAKALAHSLNVATANLVETVGPGNVASEAMRFGITGLKPVPSIGLGTTEVTLLDLTEAYACFPNGGWKLLATPVRAALDGRGQTLVAAPAERRRAIPREIAALMTGLLEDVVIFGVSNPLRSTYGFVDGVGGKTGTTNNYKDAWFIGFTPDVVAGTWVGYDAPQSLGRPAAQTALPVWAGIVGPMLTGFPKRPFAGSELLELQWIDPWSGGLARSDCFKPMRVPFLRGTAPRRYCDRDHAADWAAYYARQLSDSLGTEEAWPDSAP